MGLWPGPYSHLKPADKGNPLGYWEFLPIRKLLWEHVSFGGNGGIIYTKPKTFPVRPFEAEDLPIDKIAEVAEQWGVEVYKDNSIPFIFRAFHPDTKFIYIKRNWRDVYRSITKFERHSLYVSHCGAFDAFTGVPALPVCRAIRAYHCLVDNYLVHERQCLVIEFEDFRRNFDTTIWEIANHLCISEADLRWDRLRKLYRPKEKEC